jgi:hypothetical protein
VGNEVRGAAWLAEPGAVEREFVTLFTDDGEVIECRFEPGVSGGHRT